MTYETPRPIESQLNSNIAVSSDEPRNFGHYDHTDVPAYKTPDAVDHDVLIKYLEALSKRVTLSS